MRMFWLEIGSIECTKIYKNEKFLWFSWEKHLKFEISQKVFIYLIGILTKKIATLYRKS